MGGAMALDDCLPTSLRDATRRVRRSPGVTLIAVLSHGIGIAAVVTMFSLTNAVFLRPLPVRAAHELVNVYGTIQGQGFYNVSYAEYRDVAGQRGLFAGVLAHGFAELSLSVGHDPHRVIGELVSPNYFDVLGVR